MVIKMSISLNDIITYGNVKFKVVKFATSEDIENIKNNINKKIDLEDDWCYIYPNNGTEQNPANVNYYTRYLCDNPFPGCDVNCKPEIFYQNQWYNPGYGEVDGSNTYGIYAEQTYNKTQIIVVTGMTRVSSGGYWGKGANVSTSSGNLTYAPCRVKVWKIGKI